MKIKRGTVIACTHCGQNYIVKTLPLGPYVCSKLVCKDAENRRLMLEPSAYAELLNACKLLLEIVRVQNGNLHDDTNKAQAIALAAIANAEKGQR